MLADFTLTSLEFTGYIIIWSLDPLVLLAKNSLEQEFVFAWKLLMSLVDIMVDVVEEEFFAISRLTLRLIGIILQKRRIRPKKYKSQNSPSPPITAITLQARSWSRRALLIDRFRSWSVYPSFALHHQHSSHCAIPTQLKLQCLYSNC